MEIVRKRVSRVIAEQFHVDPDKVTEAASIDEDLHASSLDRVEVAMTLEEARAVHLPQRQGAANAFGGCPSSLG